MKRSSGILMHISSLPGKFGIGSFGSEAYKFVDFLVKSGQKYWQILPLGHTSYGDSPYQCFSAFAGNPYFIDFDLLEKEGLLNRDDYIDRDYGNDDEKVQYSQIFIEKVKVLKIAYQNFKNISMEGYEEFKKENSFWLNQYSLYMAVKEEFGLVCWQKWDSDIRNREEEAVKKYSLKLADEIEYYNFIQFIFFKQWMELKKYANENKIRIIGDLPIYVSADSSDMWSNPELFKVNEYNEPISVAGCPPDDFATTGQLWGNPIYDWGEMERTGYKWWISRIRESFKLYDVVRIDHFRGFESYWEIPYGDETAENGKWIKGPGNKLFNAIKDELGKVDIIAEDLGFMTEEVRNFRKETGFPGMKVLQFGFGGEDSSDLPHNYFQNSVAYTGTHDNETVRGWIEGRKSSEEFEKAKKYLALNEEEGYTYGFIRGVWSSVSYLAISTMQDFLDLGNEARMNIPSTIGDNWKWRMADNQLTDEIAEKICHITKLYGRV